MKLGFKAFHMPSKACAFKKRGVMIASITHNAQQEFLRDSSHNKE